MPVTGFDGGTSSRTSKQGDYHCYFMSFNPSYNGCSFKGTGNVIDDLPMDLFSVIASMRHENIAYRVDLGTIPADDTERQADFCGCYRLDEVTGQRINIPARYDATRHCWFTHAVYASSAAEAKRIGVIIERRLQQDSSLPVHCPTRPLQFWSSYGPHVRVPRVSAVWTALVSMAGGRLRASVLSSPALQ